MKVETFREAKEIFSEINRCRKNNESLDLIIKKGINESIKDYGVAQIKVETFSNDSRMNVSLDYDECVQVFDFISEMCAKKQEILQKQFDEL